MPHPSWTIGRLAKRTGVSIRALRHYDEIGLLTPVARTAAGYRVYAGEEIVRLQHIKALRQLGFSLTDIRDLLDRSAVEPRALVDAHLRHIQDRIALEQRLCERLIILSRRLAAAEIISSDEFLEIIEVMTMVELNEKYYTPEQLASLRVRAETIGTERIRQAEAEWPELIAGVRAEMKRGTDPRDPRVQALAARWRGLVQEFTGGDPEIEASLRTMYAQEPQLRSATGVQADVMAYITQAMTTKS